MRSVSTTKEQFGLVYPSAERGLPQALERLSGRIRKGEKISIRHDKATGPESGNQSEHFNAGPSGEKLRQHHFIKE